MKFQVFQHPLEDFPRFEMHFGLSDVMRAHALRLVFAVRLDGQAEGAELAQAHDAPVGQFFGDDQQQGSEHGQAVDGRVGRDQGDAFGDLAQVGVSFADRDRVILRRGCRVARVLFGDNSIFDGHGWFLFGRVGSGGGSAGCFQFAWCRSFSILIQSCLSPESFRGLYSVYAVTNWPEKSLDGSAILFLDQTGTESIA
jgi:hypothetical protein